MLALLLAVLSPFAAAPAQAQTTIWSATLTVDDDSPGFGCNNTSSTQNDDCSSPTVLTDDDFTSSGTTYTIEVLYWQSDVNLLWFGLNGLTGSATKTALSGLTLNVDGTALAISDSTAYEGNIYWSYDPATDWTDGTTVQLSLTGLPPGAVRFNFGGGEDNRLQIGIRRPTSGIVSGYDVHYTSANESVAPNDEVLTTNDPQAADGFWVVWNDPIHAGSQQRVITGLTNGLEYRVRVRARNSAGNGPWTVGKHTVGLRVIRLTPDPDLLTGLTISDGANELKLQPNVANAVGLGGPGIYAVFVHPDIKSLSLTPSWKTTANNSFMNLWVDNASRGTSSTSAAAGWGSSDNGTAKSVSLPGHVTRLRAEINVDGGTGTYTIYVYHNYDWDTRLRQLEMLTN